MRKTEAQYKESIQSHIDKALDGLAKIYWAPTPTPHKTPEQFESLKSAGEALRVSRLLVNKLT